MSSFFCDHSHFKIILYLNNHPPHNIQTNTIRKSPSNVDTSHYRICFIRPKLNKSTPVQKFLWVSQIEDFRITNHTHSQTLLYLDNNAPHNIATNSIQKPIKSRWQSLPYFFVSLKLDESTPVQKFLWVSQDENFRLTSQGYSQTLRVSHRILTTQRSE